MSEFLNKSTSNKDAVILLLQNHNPAPSIKCSYYRCVQKMLHIIYYKIGVSNDEFVAKSKIVGTDNKQNGTHKVAIEIIKGELAKKKYSDDGAWKYFQEKIKLLKRMREESDYYDKRIEMGDAQTAQAWSDAIENLLEKNF
jgi:hypothetical protein